MSLASKSLAHQETIGETKGSTLRLLFFPFFRIGPNRLSAHSPERRHKTAQATPWAVLFCLVGAWRRSAAYALSNRLGAQRILPQQSHREGSHFDVSRTCQGNAKKPSSHRTMRMLPAWGHGVCATTA